jgi:hypothetical protein
MFIEIVRTENGMFTWEIRDEDENGGMLLRGTFGYWSLDDPRIIEDALISASLWLD